MPDSQTLEQLAGRLAHFMTFRPAEVSVNAGSLSDEDLNMRLSALKTAVDGDVKYLCSESNQLVRRAWQARDFNPQDIAQAIDFLERKHAADGRYQEVTALQREYQRRVLRETGFENIYRLRQELGVKKREKIDLEGSLIPWLHRRKIAELDTTIKKLEQADKEFLDNEGIAYVHVDNRDLRKVMLSYAAQILQHYSAQINQFAILQPELLESLVQDYLQKHYVARDGYEARRGHNVFLRLPSEYQEQVKKRAVREFNRLAYLAANKKAFELIESQKRVAQMLPDAVKGIEDRDLYSEIERLKRDAQDVLQKESYDASLRRLAKEGITPEVWQVFSGRKEVIDNYGADLLQNLKSDVGAIIWGRLLRDPSETGSVSAFAFTPVTHIPYLVLNAWTQRTSRDESPVMGELGAVLSSFSEEEVAQMGSLNVPGLSDIVKTLRASPNALGTMGMTGTPENKMVDEGLAKMCAYYLQHGTPEEKYFALRTSSKLNCMVLTSTSHFNDPEFQSQRAMLTPHIANILQIPEATLKERKALIETIPYVAFGSFTFEDMQAGRALRRHG